MDQIKNTTGNLIQITVFYHLLLFLRDYILLDRFKLEYEVLDLLVAESKFSAYRADGYFILEGGYEC